MFKKSCDRLKNEEGYRENLGKNTLSFGVQYADDSLGGIFPDDLIVIGAPTGAGKTQFCVNVALANIASGKRVHFFALEAGEDEIERRLKYQAVAHFYFSDPKRPALPVPLTFINWMKNSCGDSIKRYERMAQEHCEETLQNLYTYYKTGEFTVAKLVEQIIYVEKETDLIIIDHLHYFDLHLDNENKAFKEIAMTVRDIALEAKKPIILVAHLRKRDKQNRDLAPGIDEFHGSSDITKIATKVLTIGAGGPIENGRYASYLRASKNRFDGGVSRYIGRVTYHAAKGMYDDEYKIGWSNSEKFGELDGSLWPNWARRSGNSVLRSPLP